MIVVCSGSSDLLVAPKGWFISPTRLAAETESSAVWARDANVSGVLSGEIGNGKAVDNPSGREFMAGKDRCLTTSSGRAGAACGRELTCSCSTSSKLEPHAVADSKREAR